MSTIITLSTATLDAASAAAPPARRALAKTAAIATHALGLATPSRAPPASDGGGAPSPPLCSGGAVATCQASQRMYPAETASSAGRSSGTARSAAVMPPATAASTIAVPATMPAR